MAPKTRAPKGNKEQVAARIDRCIEWLSLCQSTSEIIRQGKSEWGVGEDMVHVYISKARAMIRERYDEMDRKDWIATALEKLEKVAAMSMESRQLSNAIGAIGLQAKLIQAVRPNN